jgi:hypothetical protein
MKQHPTQYRVSICRLSKKMSDKIYGINCSEDAIQKGCVVDVKDRK